MANLALLRVSTSESCTCFLLPILHCQLSLISGTAPVRKMPLTSGSAQWQGKCPRCRKGDVFLHSGWQLNKFSAMNSACPHCNASFEPEPGFYFGAMFVSYAVNVVLFIGTWLLLYLTINPTDWVYITVIGLVGLIFTPFTFRISRVLWLYWFGGLRYDSSL